MHAWVVDHPGPIDSSPLVRITRDDPQPGPGQLRVAVRTCGVCRTDLHLAEGDLAPRRARVVPGHEVVGVVDALGPGTGGFRVGDRVGIAWLRRTCGICTYCRRGQPNLCSAPRFTGWDDDGGYAQYALGEAAYTYGIPDAFDDTEAAPLLCAGIIGFRALRRSRLPEGGRLGIYGFGASAHLAAQIALAEGATVHVVTRSGAGRRLALSLGAASACDAPDTPPEALDAAILFAPAGDLVPVALQALDRGGTLAVAGIHLSEIPPLDYARDLFEERTLTTVTANTRADGDDFLALAARIGVHVTTTPYAFGEAGAALSDLAHDRVEGAAVLVAEPAPR